MQQIPAPTPGVLAWLSVIQTIALLAIVPLARVLVSLRDDVRDVKHIVSGSPGAPEMSVVGRLTAAEKCMEGLERDVNHLYGVVRILHPELPERTPQRRT